MGQIESYRILMVGARDGVLDPVAKQLEAVGFSWTPAATGKECLSILHQSEPDAVVLEVLLAHPDAVRTTRAIRAASGVPVLAVARRNSAQACADLLGAGADAYLAEPFGACELVARVRSAVRRAQMDPYRPHTTEPRGNCEPGATLWEGNIRLELTTCRVSINGTVKTLTPNEFRLLAVFLRAPGNLFTREDLRCRVWPDDKHSLHLVEVHIANLRAKIEEDPHHPKHIVTVRSRGYKFAVAE